MREERIRKCVIDIIYSLRRISNSPDDIFHAIREFLQENQWVLVLGLFFIEIFNRVQDISVHDSIYLHTIIKYIHLIISNPIHCLNSLNTFEMNSNTPPRVVGVIPDGNRRWAKSLKFNVNSSYGHFFGAYKISNLIRWAIIDPKVSHLVVYLLSYDNYTKRSEEEQNAILDILRSWVQEFTILNRSNQADIAVLGEPDPTFQSVLEPLPINPKQRNMEKTRISLLVCYDGRREIQQAQGDPDRMWLQEDIDVVIRTGYTQRASGFCTYQTAYSEWFYVGMYWPEFSVQTFRNIINESYKIKRNFGR
jgi:tritrans,polycis-undecaprenyl-diphosphate synthase [geranylgeranyl-diphosphate specific]